MKMGMTSISNSGFPSIPVNSTLQLLENCKTMSQLRQIHAHMIKTNLISHTYAITKLMAFCSLSGVSGGPEYASSVVCRIDNPNAFIFHTAIKGFSESSNPLESVILYAQMISCLEEFNGVEFSVPSVLKACAKLLAFEEGQQVHGQISKTHLQYDLFVLNSVVRMYLELGEIELAKRVFDKMPERDIISWNSMTTGYLRAGEIEAARLLFDQMPKRDLISCNAMIDGYGKCGSCELAKEVFDIMSDKDVVTWTSMISAYVLNSRPREALNLFREMLSFGIRPDAPALVTVLSAIADLGFVEEGKWLHSYISTNKISLSSGFIESALIDMYSKCGYIENAFHVFTSISHRSNVGDWNSMISGLAIHGLGEKALEIFLDMERMDIEPNDITFLGLLSACSHGGLVDEGQFYFKAMLEKYDIVPKIQQYGCMVDLLSRAGHLEKALEVTQNMPMKADVLAWKAILIASMKYGELGFGENAALQAIELAPEDSSSYVLLSNIYAKAGRWDDVAKLRLIMRQRGVGKIPGCSSILVDGKVHEFFAGKDLNGRCRDAILSKIEEAISRLKMRGYEPDLSQVLLDTEEESKESSLSLHSEKKALAFGLTNIKKGNSISNPQNIKGNPLIVQLQ